MRSKEQAQTILDGVNLRQVQKQLGKGSYYVGDWEVEVKPNNEFISPFTNSPQLYTTRREVELHLFDGTKVTIEKEVTEWKK
ncbi:hypothetical protein [Bacillus toyonensis]|uniref:hypothetical protein n=1 Tax=Bacillus toyonensis TaxID=155322 RepID=UPI000BF08A85|nr:hypothetical protein [Bacillus toyonensis]PEL24328.1 hypothetical protein CN624_18235 [Bacillus toyonensis]